jgi:dihydroneopterin triphosphate diphosphatase
VSIARPPKIPRSVLVVIHTAELEVLLIERAGRPGFWQSVTGSLDAIDEPLRAAAAREVAEETGIFVGETDDATPPSGTPAPLPASALVDWGLSNVYEIYPVWRHRYASGVTHNTEHVFGLRVPRDVAVRTNPREHLRHDWLSWREAADRCFSPSNAEAILMLPRFVAA